MENHNPNPQLSPAAQHNQSLARGAFAVMIVQIFLSVVVGAIFILTGALGQGAAQDYQGFSIGLGVFVLISLIWLIPITIAVKGLIRFPNKNALTMGIVMLILGFLFLGILMGIAGILIVLRRPEYTYFSPNQAGANTSSTSEADANIKKS